MRPFDTCLRAAVTVAILTALTPLAAPSHATAQHTAGSDDGDGPTACAGPESHRFDFWAGTWDVESRLRTPDGWVETTATWTAREILGGCAFIDFADSDFGGGALRGMGSRYYEPDSGTWYITWMSTQAPGQLGIWEGGFDDDDSATFLREASTANGTVLTRIRWWDITDDTAEWEYAVSRDGGDSWTSAWRMSLSRVGQAPAVP